MGKNQSQYTGGCSQMTSSFLGGGLDPLSPPRHEKSILSLLPLPLCHEKSLFTLLPNLHSIKQ